jgi:hypothetical protein
MMKQKLLLPFLVCLTFTSAAQQYITREGNVHFFSSTLLEDIEADTEQMSAILDLSDPDSAKFAFQVPILTFHFAKALMEEHFNENYLESERFPTSTFEGFIENWDAVNEDGMWTEVEASGNFMLHGVNVPRVIQGQIRKMDDSWEIKASFDVLTADHKIKIPKMARKMIAESIAVAVNSKLISR